MTDDPRPRRRLFDSGFFFVLAIALASGAGVLVTQGWETFREILLSDLGLAALLMPKIAAGVLLATALALVLPKDKVLHHVGPESGLRGLAIAATAGAVIPGGPAVTFPLTAGLMTAGADLAAGVAMVTGWILLGLNRTIVWELTFLPADLVLLRVALSLPVPIVLGLGLRAVVRHRARRRAS